MAVIRLGRYTSEEDDLPDVCLKCGAPATLRKRKQFSWYPRWVYFLLLVHILVFAIVALVTTKRRTVSAPLCDEHKNHWMWRHLVVFLGFAAVVILIVAAAIISSEAGPRQDDLVLLTWTVVLLGLITWLVVLLFFHLTAIRPTEITDRSITLTGVSGEFVRAYEEEWLPDPDRLDRIAREQWDRPGRAAERRPERPPAEKDERIEREEERRPPRDRYREE